MITSIFTLQVMIPGTNWHLRMTLTTTRKVSIVSYFGTCFLFFSFFLFVVLMLYPYIQDVILDIIIYREWWVTANYCERCRHPPVVLGLINLCKPTFRMKETFSMLLQTLSKHFVVESSCQTVNCRMQNSLKKERRISVFSECLWMNL